MKITLMRHGKPVFPYGTRIHGQQVPQFEADYNAAGICTDSHPSPSTREQFKNCATIISSDLNRAMESALQFAQDIHICDPVFREPPLPHIHLSIIKLKPMTWAAWLRLSWWLQFQTGNESLKQFKQRAELAAERLISVTEESGELLLVGHGFMNIYIARALLRKGWRGPKSPGRDYWEFGTYQRNR